VAMSLRLQVVQNPYRPPLILKKVHEMRTDEAGATRNQRQFSIRRYRHESFYLLVFRSR